MYAIFVCIYEFMNVFINKFIHVSVFVFVYLFMYLYKQACIDVSICVFLNGCTGMCGLWICVSMGGGGSQYLMYRYSILKFFPHFAINFMYAGFGYVRMLGFTSSSPTVVSEGLNLRFQHRPC